MSRLDFCQYELVNDCYDWKNDNCDECNIFKAYCEGERRAVETTAQYDDFHEEIKRLTRDVEYYQDRYEAVVRINDSQWETIRTYKAIMDILDAENKRLRGETE